MQYDPPFENTIPPPKGGRFEKRLALSFFSKFTRHTGPAPLAAHADLVPYAIFYVGFFVLFELVARVSEIPDANVFRRICRAGRSSSRQGERKKAIDEYPVGGRQSRAS
ncbi:hypothetical protein [Paraburkholderia sp. Cpub6]|uniref:hypothetical protein n=1 Tax=Paraburkholderia sp. Cpub6 TaxID=2723094 RepID=UPI001607D5C9|nr:hypothetical protein [Paraburkholderia sp. Cpub6]MBB5463208.1 hypothetical protein [Paraburkholderia sp. Cpub6]